MRLFSIYRSLQGEGIHTGKPTVFVRLADCNLTCSYCDTEASHPRKTFTCSVGQVIKQVEGLMTPRAWNDTFQRVEITGGEPLLQREEVVDLCSRLTLKGYIVDVETNGTLPILDLVSKQVKPPQGNLRDITDCVIMDIKTPSERSRLPLYCLAPVEEENLEELRAKDQVKFVCSDLKDAEWAFQKLKQYQKIYAVKLFSAVWGKLEVSSLFDWWLHAAKEYPEVMLPGMPILQTHKYVWEEREDV